MLPLTIAPSHTSGKTSSTATSNESNKQLHTRIACLIPGRLNRVGFGGFTLIELIVVIMILGILTAYAQSKLSTQPFDERYLYDDILSAIQYTQKLAVGSGCQVRFLIDDSHFELKLDTNCETEDPVAFTTDVSRPLEPTVAFANTSFPSSLTSVTNTDIVFYPQGWACNAAGDSTSTVSINLIGQVARGIQVVCSTGFISEV